MGTIRLSSLRWAVGAFSIVLSSMMLVAPHEFNQPGYLLVRPALIWWAAALLLAGGCLIGLSFVTAAPWARRAGYLAVALPLGVIAISQLQAGGRAPAAWYSALTVGVIVTALVPEAPEKGDWWDRPDILSLAMGAGATVIGGLGFLSAFIPGGSAADRRDLLLISVLCLAGGAIMVTAQLSRSFRRSAGWLPHLIVPLALFAYVGATWRERSWLPAVICGVFGTALLALPWLGPWLARLDRRSLRTRLALALAITAALPLVFAVTFIMGHQESVLSNETRAREQRLARALANSVAQYIALHRGGIEFLAAQPGLVDQPVPALRTQLQAMIRAYPEIRAFAVFDATGQPIARNDEAPATPVTGYPIYELARQSDGPSLDILISPIYGRPVFGFGVPTRDENGRFDGLVVAALDTARVAQLLNETSDANRSLSYLVDSQGRAIAHPRAELAERFADLAGVPSVAALIGGDASAGSLTYELADSTWLAGYARVPGTSWGVVVEQPLTVALASAQAGRTLAFQTLVIFIVLAGIAGAVIAGRMTGPLAALTQATGKLAEGDDHAPLPTTSTSEVAHLAARFGEMRDRLAARTAEREAAQAQLHALNVSLEERIADRTSRLQRAVADLESGMAELRRAEAEREQLLDQVQFQQDRLEAVLRQMPAGVVIVEARTGSVVLANRRAEELLEASLGSGMLIASGRMGQPVQPDGSPRSPKSLPLYRAVNNGEIVSGEELQFRRKDGRIATMNASAAPIRDAEGNIIAGVLSLTDVTQQKRAQDAQRFLSEASSVLASSLDYEVILSILPQLAVPHIGDWCGIHLVEDERWARRVALVHKEPERAAPLIRLLDHFPIDQPRRHGVAWVLQTGQSELVPTVDEQWLREFGPSPEQLAAFQQLGFCSYMCVPLIARGRIVGAIAFGSASPERRFGPSDLALAEDLARRAAPAVDNAGLYRAAREAVQAREEFLSVAAHELKTPVTSLRGFAQLAARQIERGEDIDLARIQRALKVIDQQSDKLTLLVSHLLDTSRIEAGKLTLDVRETDVTALVCEVIATVQATTTRHTISLTGPVAVRAKVDPLRLEQVMTNLLDNAVKYSPQGGPIDVHLEIEPAPDETWLRIAVADHGIGIPPEHRARIFDRFYQAHTASHVSGMGLGLHISQQIVELHGGELSVEFPTAGVTRFVVRVPTGLAPAAPVTAPAGHHEVS